MARGRFTDDGVAPFKGAQGAQGIEAAAGGFKPLPLLALLLDRTVAKASAGLLQLQAPLRDAAFRSLAAQRGRRGGKAAAAVRQAIAHREQQTLTGGESAFAHVFQLSARITRLQAQARGIQTLREPLQMARGVTAQALAEQAELPR